MREKELNGRVLRLYTDGSAQQDGKHTSPGGWAYALVVTTAQGKEISIYEDTDRVPDTTNNKMELMAVWKGLLAAIRYGSNIDNIEVYTDSAYIVDAFNRNYIPRWKKQGWKTLGQHKTLKNLEQWLGLIALSEELGVKYIKVKAHSGDKWNEYVNKLAYDSMQELAVSLNMGRKPKYRPKGIIRRKKKEK
jgi:ribonuclease HI